MAHWKDVLTQLSPDAEARMAELRGRLYAQLGGVGPVKIITFRGYGAQNKLYIQGRVIEEKTYLTNVKDDEVWAGLVDIYSHARSARVPHARLVARFQGMEKTLTADADGFFEAQFEPRGPLAQDRHWHPVELHLLEPIPEVQSRYPVKDTGEVLVPADSARYGVISNIDESILPRDRSDLLYMARSAFLRSPHNRQPFPGEAALYRSLYSGLSGADMNPVFYLSCSKGNLYNLLVQYINLQSMPNGPILFAYQEKLNHLRRLLDLYPHLPFLLFGNSERDDPRVYTRLAAEYPGRIPAIYIRHTRPHPWRGETPQALAERARKAGSLLVLAPDSLTIASHAVEHGFLPSGALAEIHKDKQKDESPLGPVEALLSEPFYIPQRAAKISRRSVKKDCGELDRSAGRERKTAPFPKAGTRAVRDQREND